MRGRPLGPIDGPWPNRLRDVRQAAGLTLEQVAKTLGVSTIHAGRIERGYTRLSPAHGGKLLKILTVNYDDLVSSPRERIDMRVAHLRERLTNGQQMLWLEFGEQLLVASQRSVRLQGVRKP